MIYTTWVCIVIHIRHEFGVPRLFSENVVDLLHCKIVGAEKWPNEDVSTHHLRFLPKNQGNEKFYQGF